VVKGIEEHWHSGLLVNAQAVGQGIVSFVILDNQMPYQGFIQSAVSLHEALQAAGVVFVGAPDVNLYLGGSVQAQQVEHVRVVDQLLDASFRYAFIRRIEQYELIGMHGYPHAMGLDEGTDIPEILPEEILPVETAYGMGSKRDQIRGYPEKKDMVFGVESEHLKKTLKVVADRAYQTVV